MSHILDDAEKVASQLLEQASQHGFTLASAESLTGGMVGEILCSVPGASAAYLGGVISYAYSVKEQVLGVDCELLAREGAVHEEVARQMANGAAQLCRADYAVATTGVAGPEPHGGKEVGSVVLGIKTPEENYAVIKKYSGDRQAIREQASRDALSELLMALDRRMVKP